MALGFKDTVANSILNAFGRNTSYTGVTTLYVKLHTGTPGTGSSNAAGNTSRQAVAFSAASGGSMANSGAVTWTSVSTSETYTNCSLWDDPTAGALQATGSITANAVTSGDTFTIAISGMTVTLSVAA